MSQQELLNKVIRTLEDIGIQYMITGSVVSSLQGEPRSTYDIDVIVAIQKSAVKKLIEAFPPPIFYLDKDSILEAIDNRNMFNLIEVEEGDKVDFWVLTDEPFDQSRFFRKHVKEVMGVKMQVSSPEDTIIAKLRWAKLSGGSEKHFTDALRVYEVQFEKLDRDYLKYWVKILDVERMWERLLEEAKII